MDLMDIFNEVLATDRRLSQDFHEKKEENEHKYKDNTLDISHMSYIVNPTFASGPNTKPFLVSSQYISRKKVPNKNSAYLDELKHLLALSEIRYVENVNKLKAAIKANKKLYFMRTINFIRTVYPALKNLRKLMIRIYLYRWYSRFAQPDVQELRYYRTSAAKMKADAYRMFKLRSLLLVLDKINKVNTLKAFIIFKERGIMYEFGIQYYGAESIAKKKLNRFVLPHKKEESFKAKFKKLGIDQPQNSEKYTARNLNRIKSYFK